MGQEEGGRDKRVGGNVKEGSSKKGGNHHVR